MTTHKYRNKTFDVTRVDGKGYVDSVTGREEREEDDAVVAAILVLSWGSCSDYELGPVCNTLVGKFRAIYVNGEAFVYSYRTGMYEVILVEQQYATQAYLAAYEKVRSRLQDAERRCANGAKCREAAFV